MFQCAGAASIDADNEESIDLSYTPVYVTDEREGSKQVTDGTSSAEMDIERKLASMTLEEKIGQLLMIAVYSNKGNAEVQAAKRLIKDHHLGGIMFLRDTKKTSSPTRQLQITNELQRASRTPLMVAIDGEWGLSMRLDSTVAFPRQLTLGAHNDNHLIQEMGKEIGRQCKRLGIHINFAPVVDVNNNPNNPVINDRSFGENMFNVADKGMAYMRGLHEAGVLACAKHFPGHGDTDTDSHYALPQINHSRRRLDSLELFPFKRLIEARLGTMMVAHLNIPSLDPSPGKPSVVSKPIVTDLLRRDLRFDGLVFTDALNMKGATNYSPSGKLEVEALKAGNDVLLFPLRVSTAIEGIKQALNNGEITEARIDESVRRILAAKRWMGILEKPFYPGTSFVHEDLNRPATKYLAQRLYEKSITVVKNDNNLLPLRDLRNYRIATVGIDNGKRTPFQTALDDYAPMTHFSISGNATDAEFNQLLSKLKGYNLVLVGLVNSSRYPSRNFGVTMPIKSFLRMSALQSNTVVSVFGNPYSLAHFADYKYLICGYDRATEAQRAAAQVIFGALQANGKLPVAASYLPQGSGIPLLTGNLRLKHTNPNEIGLDQANFYKVDSVANAAIRIGATPGCQILITKDNKVIYHKSFGYHTQNKRRKVRNSDIYDLASITKITASVPSIMKAYEEGKIGLNDRLSRLLPEAANTNKAFMTPAEILTHTSGLRSWIPFYKKTIDKNKRLNSNYSRSYSNTYSYKIANNMYIKPSYEKDSMRAYIYAEDNNARGRYVYSDLGYYLFKEILERKYSSPLENLVQDNFYKPLGLKTLMYNPLDKFPADQIVPSEKDNYWRNQTVHGYVHDMGAAMQGGVGGHAGIFGNASDLAVYMQMFLNKGTYGGVQFFRPETVKRFTRKQNSKSRRALGFDKPELDTRKIGPTSEYAPASSFGHTGFTGTYAWADPDNNLILIFLSNRTYPTASNKRLITQNIRPKVQAEVYKVFGLPKLR